LEGRADGCNVRREPGVDSEAKPEGKSSARAGTNSPKAKTEDRLPARAGGAVGRYSWKMQGSTKS